MTDETIDTQSVVDGMNEFLEGNSNQDDDSVNADETPAVASEQQKSGTTDETEDKTEVKSTPSEKDNTDNKGIKRLLKERKELKREIEQLRNGIKTPQKSIDLQTAKLKDIDLDEIIESKIREAQSTQQEKFDFLKKFPKADSVIGKIEAKMEEHPSLSYAEALYLVNPSIALDGEIKNQGNEMKNDGGGRAPANLRSDKNLDSMTTKEMRESLSSKDVLSALNLL